ncbi:glutaredoxin domain-containing protein [Leucobacter celer]|uniref:glutaredoxin domain-containing protein n=1 Tax=Leucobacter celer TaxID=668625 RepID=UPI000A4B75FC|nr:glutaredoxin domain-containing protein [Leucobacter celer]
MTAHLSRPERVAVARLHALLELLPAALDKRLGPIGITAFEYTLLERLAESDGHRLRLSALAAKTNASLPRISRVASSLERRGLIERAPCEKDGRATNAVLTARGAETHELSHDLYAAAVRELILDGLATLPGDGVSGLADLAYAVLGSLDPERRGGAWDVAPDESSGPPGSCAADPEPLPASDPEAVDCAADPAPPADRACPADPDRASRAPSDGVESDAMESEGTNTAPATADAATGTIIFGADWCGDCRRAKLVFDRAGAPYTYIDLVQDPAAADVAHDISGRTNIPVILYPDRSHQVEPSNADMLRKIEELRLVPGAESPA